MLLSRRAPRGGFNYRINQKRMLPSEAQTRRPSETRVVVGYLANSHRISKTGK
jgi:hypothetical protein